MKTTPILCSAALALLTATSAFADQVILDDLIVDGSIGVGTDVVNGEDFSYDTIRLKENNLRIKFMDTSNSGSFPTNDWEITINDSSNGGQSYFQVLDVDHGTVPFRILAGATSNSLFVGSNGYIGNGTNAPVQNLHLASDDSPAIRLEQTENGGLGAQSWDIIGNEAGISFLNVTSGNTVPFRLLPGAPTNSLFVGANGTGIGIGSAMHKLHVRETEDLQAALIENTNAASAERTVLQLANNGPASLEISNTTTSATASDWLITVNDAGSLVISSGGTDLLTLDSIGNLTVTGSVSDASDINRKEAIQSVNIQDVLQRLSSVPMNTWRYKGDAATHIGPMAQDFYNTFSVGITDKAIAKVDADGVALASIQALYQDSQAKDQEIDELKQANRALEERLMKLEAMMEQL